MKNGPERPIFEKFLLLTMSEGLKSVADTFFRKNDSGQTFSVWPESIFRQLVFAWYIRISSATQEVSVVVLMSKP